MPTPSHPYSAALVVPAALRDACEALAGAALGRDCTGEIGAPLSAGESEPTHFWCNVSLTPEEYWALLVVPWPEGVEVFTTVTPRIDDVEGATTAVPDGEGGWTQEPVYIVAVGEEPPAEVNPFRRRWIVPEGVLTRVGLAPPPFEI